MATVKIKPVAEDEIKEIERFYGPKSERYKTFDTDIKEHCRSLLGLHPKAGKKVPGRDMRYFRQLIYRGKFRIIYLYDESLDSVEILTVQHTSRKF